MQQNYLNNYSNQNVPNVNPNAVNINIFTPQAYGNSASPVLNSQNANQDYYSMYGTNTMPNLPLYPQNYNNAINYSNNATNPITQNNYPQQAQNQLGQGYVQDYYNPSVMYPNGAQPLVYPQGTIPQQAGYNYQYPQAYPQPYPQVNPQAYPQAYPQNGQIYPNQNVQNQINPQAQTTPANMLPNDNDTLKSNLNETNLINKNTNSTNNDENEAVSSKKDKKEKDKVITPLSNDYVKNLENYLNSDNPKIRLIGIKEVMERFKEDENRKDNPSLIPLLNKALQDTSPSVRFVALTALKLGYSVGNDETVKILEKIANENQDKFGQDALLASEVLLKLSAPAEIKVEGGNK